MAEDQVPVVEARQLGKTVALADGGSLTILQDISFTVAQAETVAVVGASGSGKSTLLGLLAGLDLPSQGHVAIRGQDLSRLDEDGRALVRREHVGFVFQSFQLLPALTALENVMMPLELAGLAGARERACGWLERVGLAARLSHYPRHLSGGEQQRVALARAFAIEPSLLLADEPTGNLDGETGHQLIELMFELNREAHTTMILVTHDEGLAQRCGRCIRLREGSMDEETGRVPA